jgi:CHAT domain
VHGKQVGYRIVSRDVWSFSLNTSPHQFVNRVVDQGETDLIVTMFAPDGQRFARFDGRGRGIERVSFLAEHAGTCRAFWATFETVFYSALVGETRPSPAAALRAAQKPMRAQNRWSHPYYWSGLVLQGES